MMANYPSPCEKCSKNNNGSCSHFRTCGSWLMRYRYRQRQINAYAERIGIKVGGERMVHDGIAKT